MPEDDRPQWEIPCKDATGRQRTLQVAVTRIGEVSLIAYAEDVQHGAAGSCSRLSFRRRFRKAACIVAPPGKYEQRNNLER